MQVFPQLSSGANAQYPLVRVRSSRTVVNVMQDGSQVKFGDVATERTRWALQMHSLDEAERVAVEGVFMAVGGQLRAFTLLDPAANLLSWSEDFGKAAWVADPLLQRTSGVGGWTLTNTGQVVQGIAQSVAGPAGFEYCFSVYVQGSGSVSLVRSSGGVTETRGFVLTSERRRISTAGRLAVTGDSVQMAIRLSPGATATVFGAQLEAQPGAGAYKRSLGDSGVVQVRFASGRLETEAVGLDRNSSVIHLVSVE